ncbi:phosphatidylserine decarboxylase [Phakopsora pachyrhizi]|uniref:Phosphatidylserine decarboxylase proenzyme 2 n=1 Tax=Phakopsora pachyrhizi TaxID=170000 RepID=A0AAV0AJ99_PHAPC|nr:phosphatidylserine decarboxylase [Phakopsora pachyrhizi]CAH7667916.1 phosphatidylserine decarboxylase [Phakopsora pachyrhizi]
MLSPTHYNRSAQPSGGRTLSNLKGALVKKIPRGSKSQSAVNSSDEKQQPKALSSTSGNVSNSTEDSQGHQKCRKKKAPLGLGRRSKSDYSLRAGIDGVGDVVGLCFIEVNRASGLPYWKAVTRIGFDMDPFVIISFGEKIFRTRVIRHCLDPVWDEKMFFHVRQHETAYSILFNVFDWDKMSSNDYIGQSEVLLEDLIKENQTKMKLDQETALYEVDEQGKLVGDYMSNFELPIVSNSSSASQEEVFNGKLSIKAKFTPYSALRQLFWRKYLEQFDTDDSGTISNVELVSMLDSLGSTLTQETISDFFSRYGKSAEADGDVLSFEQVICCLESELIKPPEEKRRINISDEQIGVGQAAAQRQGTLVEDDSDNSDKTQMSSSADLSFVGYGAKGEFVTKAKSNPNPVVESDGLDPTGEQSPETQNPIESQPRLRLEKVVNISRCPICHKQRIGSRMEIDLVTHMAVCASQDWSTLQNILSPGNFVTSSQAHRKWFTKVIGKVQNGRYSLGADSANIIVQDRRSGQLIEEKMQAYVRLGIRLMYKSGGSKDRMQTQRMKKLLKSLTIKQGVKFDSPDSVKEIRPFIAFHGLDLEEVKLPLQEFKTFNEFFYRELKPGARPIEAAGDPRVLVSCADCRMMVFDDLHQSRKVWIKSREFSLEKLLGSSALSLSSRGCSTQPELTDDKRWALAIFRLAPQDYHRFHAPIDGVVEEIEHINGQYYTVNPMAIRSTIDVYGENVRIVVTIQTEKFGKAYCVFVGAMMVGSINTCLKVGDRVKKGDDVGYFAFGGSTILTLFKSDKIRWDEDLRTNSNNSIETLVRVGNRVGAATS